MPDHSLIIQVLIMGDPVWLCLFNADFSDKSSIKGNLRVKIKIADIQSLTFDKNDAKRLNVIFKEQTLGEILQISLHFESILQAKNLRDFV